MSKQIKNAFSRVVKTPKGTPQGQAGYDNPRENVDPHVKTQAISTNRVILPKDGVATGVNFGVPSKPIILKAEGWNGAAGFDTETQLVNYQPVGGTTKGNLGIIMNGDLRFLIDENGMVFVPDLAGGDEYTFGSSVAASGKGTNIRFMGGNAVSGNNDGGDLRMEPGLPSGSGVPGTVNFGQSGLADQGCIFFVDAYIRFFDQLNYNGREQHTAATTQTADAANNVITTSTDLEDDASMRVEAEVMGTESDGSDRALYRIQGLFYRNGGNITQQGTTVSLITEESDTDWNCDFQVNTTDQTVEVYVNGNGDTVNWNCHLKISKVTT